MGNSFEAGRWGILPEPNRISQTVARWQGLREQSLRVYLEFPEHFRGAVTSGQALNFFLDLCADVVMSHAMWRSQIQDEIRRMDARILQLKQRSPGETAVNVDSRGELESLRKERDDATSRLLLLDNLRGNALLDQELVRHLRFARDLSVLR